MEPIRKVAAAMFCYMRSTSVDERTLLQVSKKNKSSCPLLLHPETLRDCVIIQHLGPQVSAVTVDFFRVGLAKMDLSQWQAFQEVFRPFSPSQNCGKRHVHVNEADPG